jgi:gliding motility-associated-like protein
MKKNLLTTYLLFFAILAQGQINIATGGTVTTCSDVFVDSGGLLGSYSSSENYEITICPDTAGNYIQLDFTTVNIEGGFDDFLVIYNGSSSSDPILGTINDDAICDITQYTSSAMNGCLTIVFESDNSFNPSGWEAAVTCTTISGGSSTVPENSICGGSGAFCADAGALEFPNSSDNDCVPNAPSIVVDNSCLGSAPNPAWYFVEIGLAGNIIIDIAQTTGSGGTGTGLDVDYVVWGPFPDVPSACVDFTAGNCTGDHNCIGTAVDCSYSTDPTETATIPNAQVGEFYMFLITNFDGAPGYITLTQTNLGNAGAGSTDCCPYLTGINPSTCGASDGVIEIALLTPNTSYTITYNDPVLQSVTLTSNALGEINITGLSAGTYTNIDTNTPACSPEDITLIDAAAPVLNSLTTTSPICSGTTADFVITGTPNAIVTYTINGGVTSTINLGASGNATISVIGVTANTVIALTNISINSCTTVLTNIATVVVNPIPIFNSVNSNTAVCTGLDAVFTISGSPNATVTYTINGGATMTLVLDASGNGIVTIIGMLVDTTIIVSNIALNGCDIVVNDSETVIIDPVLAVSSLLGNGPICSGEDAVFDVVGSPNSIITYSVNGGVPLILNLDTSGIGLITVLGATATVNINLISLSLSGCSILLTHNETIIVTPTPSITSLTTISPICSGENAVFIFEGTPNSTISYVVNGGVPATVVLDAIGTGVVTVFGSVSDVTLLTTDIVINGCNMITTDSETVLVTAEPELAINTNSNPTICLGTDGSITLTTSNLPDGSYTVSYVDGTATSQTETLVVVGNIGTISNLPSGTYNNITITYLNCTSIDVIDIQLTDPQLPVLAINTISNPTICDGNDGMITLTTSNLPDGSYTVNYVDSTATPETATIIVVGNVGIITGLLEGEYNNITITYNNCTSTDAIDILLSDPLPSIIAIISTSNPTLCEGTDGSIILSTANLPDGTYTATYEDASAMQQTTTIVVTANIGVIAGLSSGIYNNIAVTYLSCTSVDDIDVELSDPIPSIIALIAVVHPSMCNSVDGSIVLSVANLIDGVYTVNYEDVNGISQTTLITVVNNIGTIMNLSSGAYNNITITNFSCVSVEDVDVLLTDPVPAILSIISATNPSTCNGSDGVIILSTFQLPDGMYTINYEDITAIPQTETMVVVDNVGTIIGLFEGAYNNITVTHLGCISLEDVDVILVDPLPPIINNNMNMQPICETDANIDGIMPHDLTTNISVIIGNQTGITVMFYETLVDALTNNNPIINESSYFNINPTLPVSTQTINVRAVDDFTECFTTTSFTITVMSTEAEVPNPLSECDDDNDGYHYFVLDNATTLNEITNGNASVMVSYYETLSQANSGFTNAQLTSPYQNILAYNQTIYARVQLTTFDCYRIVELQLNVIDGPMLPQGDLLYAQCENIGSIDGVVIFDLVSYEIPYLLSEIITNGGDISNYTVNYYTHIDASGDPDLTTLINNPSIFQNTFISNQTIYASVIDNTTGCQSIQPIMLHVDLLPVANYSEQHKCDDEVTDGYTEFNLTEYISTITSGVTTIETIFYTNQTDAELGSGNNIIFNPTSFVNTINPQSIFVRVSNPETECFAIALMVLHVDPLPTPLSSETIISQLGNNGVMEKCDGNVDGSGAISEQVAEFDLTLWETQILTGNGPGVETGVSASYYTSYNDAVIQEHIIMLPTTYTNTSNPQTIYVRVTNDGTGVIPITEGSECYVIVEFQIYVPIPQIIISGNDLLCVDENGVPITNVPLPILFANVTPVEPYDYQWALNGVNIPGATNQSHTVTQAGEYTVTVSGPSNFNCINYTSVVVEVSGVPDNYNANVTTNAFANSHQIVAIATSNNPNIEFLYALDEGELSVSGIFNNVSPGIHIITITDSRGCWKELISILVIDYPKFFTPNGDGVNDTWQIIGVEGISISIIYIFDRYGKLLKQLDPDGLGWNGTYNGNLMPASDYWFKIIYIEGSSPPTEKEFKAHFSLKR